MATLKVIENQIFRLEGFRVRFRDRYTSKDVRADLKGVTAYPFKLMAKNRMTVATWKRTRFHRQYQGFQVDVRDADGNDCNGNMFLATVRDTYLD